METWHDIALRKLRGHSALGAADEEQLRALTGRTRSLQPGEDLIRQGDTPQTTSLVASGMIARYHAMAAGSRQYLSFHFPGDWPDAQTIFLERMDHGVCAIGPASVVCIRHDQLRAIFESRPSIGFALWRETLIDAAIFRGAISNNSGRATLARMAHLFCELFYRAQAAGVVFGNTVPLPLNQAQLGEALGIALVTVNRLLQALRRTEAMDFRNGTLRVSDWDRLAAIGEFDPDYLSVTDRPSSRESISAL
jgi:CRP-like cAMP-binding protein